MCIRDRHKAADGQRAKYNGDDAEHDADLDLAPTAHFKMMMNGSHLENALAVGGLEIRHLQNDGKNLTQIDDSDKKNQDRQIYAETESAHNTAQAYY